MTDRSLAFKERVLDERRRSILGAARQLFVAHGYAGTTIEAIADAAGVAKGTVYLHFATKDDLLVDLMLQATEEALGALAAIVATGQPAPEQIAGCLRACARSWVENRDLIATNLPTLRAVCTARLGSERPAEMILRQIAGIARLGQQEGTLRADADPNTIGLMVLMLAQLPSSLQELRPGEDGMDTVLEQVNDILVRGIVRSPVSL